ncbi:MAG: enoyl-CoA hydratase/isomerase family protein [Saprospiraceae bacterium]|nr:enoyl-CoA hydratase/isomerase family protein [Saprospiraceae bacterium]
MNSNTIKNSLEDGLAILTLHRPEVFHSFNREMSHALRHQLESAAANDEVRAIMITGSGKAFSAGQDLSEATDVDGPTMETILNEHYNPLVRTLRSIDKPVIAAVNGVAAGAGANLAICCDIILASTSASFIQAFSKIGLIPDSGGTFFLPRMVGWHRAMAYMMTAEKMTAQEAKDFGLVFKLFDDASFTSDSISFGKNIASMPTRALVLTKKALNASSQNSLDEQLAEELKLQMEAGKTYDFREGVAAFLEKRKPAFKGK